MASHRVSASSQACSKDLIGAPLLHRASALRLERAWRIMRFRTPSGLSTPPPADLLRVRQLLLRGGKVSITQVATDAFGNALGSSLAEQVNDSRTAARINADQMRSSAEDAAADRWAFDKTQREDAQAWADTQTIFAKNRPATYSEGKTRFDVVSDSGMEWNPNNDMAGLGNLQDGDLLAAARKPKLLHSPWRWIWRFVNCCRPVSNNNCNLA
jgi:hypothetical protein